MYISIFHNCNQEIVSHDHIILNHILAQKEREIITWIFIVFNYGCLYTLMI